MNTQLILIDELENRFLLKNKDIDIVFDMNKADVAYVTFSKIDFSTYPNIKHVLCPCTNTKHITVNKTQTLHYLDDAAWLGSNVRSTVEWTIWAIMNLLKSDHNNRPNEIFGKTVGIIGMGRIGQKVARILRSLGCHLIYHDPYVEQCGGILNISLERIMKYSQIITVHAVSNESTFKLISEEQFNQVRHRPYFINCSRGAVVSGKALWNCYTRNKLKGFAIDVIDTYDPETIASIRHESLISNRVIFTDHKAGSSIESRIATDSYVIDKYITTRGQQNGEDENNSRMLQQSSRT